jgi:hypothetical protein
MTQPAIYLKQHAVPVVIGALLLIMLGYIVFGVPGNMDEHSTYHALACWSHPTSRFNIGFTNDCHKYKLWLFGHHVWGRSYYYLGIIPNLIYAPLYLLWNSPYSANLLGLLLYVLAIVAARRLLHVGWVPVTVAFGSNYFLLYLAVRDSGVVAIHILAALCIPLLMARIMTAPDKHRYWLYSLTLGLLVFAAFEAKPVFVYYIPGIAVLAAAIHPEWLQKKNLILAGRRLLPAALLSLALSLLLLSLSTRPDIYVSYAAKLSSMGKSVGMQGYLHKLDFATECISQMTNTASFLKRSGWTHCLWKPRYDDLASAMPQLLSMCYLLLVAVAAGYCAWRRPQRRRLLAGLLLAGVVSLMSISLQGKAIQAHHFFLPWVMWSLALAVALSEIKCAWIAIALCVVGMGCAFVNTHARPTWATAWDRWPVMRKLHQPDIAPYAMVVNLQWGTYFISSLYAPPDLFEVEFKDFDIRPRSFQIKSLNVMRAIAWSTGRRLLFVGLRKNYQWHVIKRHFPGMRRLYPPPGVGGRWVVWGDRGWKKTADWSR